MAQLGPVVWQGMLAIRDLLSAPLTPFCPWDQLAGGMRAQLTILWREQPTSRLAAG